MLTRILLAIVVAALAGCGSQPPQVEDTEGLSLVRLIANPGVFNGKTVRTVGFLRREFEGRALYLSRVDRDNAVAPNALWLSFDPDPSADQRSLAEQYVMLEGLFDSTGKGHGSMYAGTIRDIKQIKAWAVPPSAAPAR